MTSYQTNYRTEYSKPLEPSTFSGGNYPRQQYALPSSYDPFQPQYNGSTGPYFTKGSIPPPPPGPQIIPDLEQESRRRKRRKIVCAVLIVWTVLGVLANVGWQFGRQFINNGKHEDDKYVNGTSEI